MCGWDVAEHHPGSGDEAPSFSFLQIHPCDGPRWRLELAGERGAAV